MPVTSELDTVLSGLGKPDSDGKLYAVLINCGTPNIWRKVYPANGTDFKIKELYDFVGSPVEMVPIDENIFMIINEEGKLKDLPLNMTATMISGLYPRDVIVGHALICGEGIVL